jgi:hypothetical protein
MRLIRENASQLSESPEFVVSWIDEQGAEALREATHLSTYMEKYWKGERQSWLPQQHFQVAFWYYAHAYVKGWEHSYSQILEMLTWFLNMQDRKHRPEWLPKKPQQENRENRENIYKSEEF